MEGNYILFYNKELNVPLRCVHFGFSWRFVASDVCAALGLDANIIIDRKLFCWERGICPVYIDGEVVDCVCIPDDTVYQLCAKSNSANADIFKRWVSEEVMPRLRGDAATHNLCVIVDQLLFMRGMMERIEAKLDKI